MLSTLIFAPAVLAQGVEAGTGTGPYGCPEDHPYVATHPGDPGEGSLLCFPTQAEARRYALTGEVERADPDTATSSATAAATSTPTATTTPTATAAGSGTATATATASSTATQTPADEQGDEREDEQTTSEERESRDETTSSEGSRKQTRSQDKTTPTETGEVSNRYPITLAAGIALMGLALCGFLATRAILPWRR
jgi:hypothetical protein